LLVFLSPIKRSLYADSDTLSKAAWCLPKPLRIAQEMGASFAFFLITDLTPTVISLYFLSQWWWSSSSVAVDAMHIPAMINRFIKRFIALFLVWRNAFLAQNTSNVAFYMQVWFMGKSASFNKILFAALN